MADVRHPASSQPLGHLTEEDVRRAVIAAMAAMSTQPSQMCDASPSLELPASSSPRSTVDPYSFRAAWENWRKVAGVSPRTADDTLRMLA